MRFYLQFWVILMLSFSSFAQYFGEDRFGVTVGATNYIMDTNFISSKSATGFLVGATSGIGLSDSFEVLVDMNLNYHRVKLLGRENETATPEDLNFNMQNLGLSTHIHYKFLEKEELTFGLNLGATGTIFYGYNTNHENESYLIDPLQIAVTYMNFDKWSDVGLLNAFVSFGLSAQYENFMANLRYYKGVTNPYRHTPVYSPYVEFTGKDNYWSFTITYFFNN